METFKNGLAVFAAIIGVLTGLLTLYAKYLDVKKSDGGESDAADTMDAAKAAVRSEPNPYAPSNGPLELLANDFPPRQGALTVAQARAMVKAPAITLMIAGAVSLFFNLFTAGFGYVDQYVTPLTTESQARRATIEAAGPGSFQLIQGMARPSYGTPEDPNAPLTIVMLMSFSVASAAAIWGGYDMLRLRGYWLSVAGSIAIMPGAGICCMAGFPIGIWSLVILFRPEVSSSFR